MFIIKNNNIFNVSNASSIRKDKEALILTFFGQAPRTVQIKFRSALNASEAYEALVDAIMSNRSIRLEELNDDTVLHYYLER